MSNLLTQNQISDSKDCPNIPKKIKFQKVTTRDAQIGGGLSIKRALPHHDRRMIGAWCFFDHFGPLDAKLGSINVAPHPHTGLQTFTYLLDGKILHRDSIGSFQHIEPGQVNIMTAGYGVSHSENSVPSDAKYIHGVQLWIALPDEVRNSSASFFHHDNLPLLQQNNFQIKVLAGEFNNNNANVTVHTPLVCLHIHALKDAETRLNLNPEFEYGILLLSGDVKADDETLHQSTLLYSPPGHHHVTLTARRDSHIFIVGGKPFEEEVLLWWNFVARNKDEIAKATTDWQSGQRFGEVKNYPGERLEAPALPW